VSSTAKSTEYSPCGVCHKTDGKCVHIIEENKLKGVLCSSESATPDDKWFKQSESGVYGKNLWFLSDPSPWKTEVTGEIILNRDKKVEWLETPLTGKQASVLQLEVLGFPVSSDEKVRVSLTKSSIHPSTGNPVLLPMTGELYSDENGETQLLLIQKKRKKNEDGTPYINGKGQKEWENNNNNHAILGFEELTKFANRGETIYIRPNALGGKTTQKDWLASNTVFIEIDGTTIEQQKRNLSALAVVIGLVPHLVVFSGKKSLHAYFKINKVEKTTDDFYYDYQRVEKIQQKLVLVYNSDPAITDAGRLMRFAGVNRTVGDKINHQSIFQYSYHEPYSLEEIELRLCGAFPHGLSDTRWKLARQYFENPEAFEKKHGYGREGLHTVEEERIVPKKRDYNFSIFEDSQPMGNDTAVPLIRMLYHRHQDLISHGVEAGGAGRNPTGLSLANAIVCIEKESIRYGIKTVGKGLDLLIEYGNNCSPIMEEWECLHLYSKAVSYSEETLDSSNTFNKKEYYFNKAKRYLSSRFPGEWELIAEKIGYKEIQEATINDFCDDVIFYSSQKATDKKGLGYIYFLEEDTYKTFEETEEGWEEFNPTDYHLHGTIISKELPTLLEVPEGINYFSEDESFWETYYDAKLKIEQKKWVNQKQTKEKREWTKKRYFTPTDVTTKEYFDFNSSNITSRSLVGIKSALGTGKTTWAVQLVKDITECRGKGSMLLSHRNALATQTGHKLGAVHIHDNLDKFEQALKDPKGNISLCVDSILKLRGRYDLISGKTVIIDEIESFVDHLLTSPGMALRRIEILEALGFVLTYCGTIILLDGNITDERFNYIKKKAGLRTVFKITNNQLSKPFDITVLAGSTKSSYDLAVEIGQEQEGLNKQDKSGIYKEILACTDNFAVAGDCKILLTAFHKKLQEQGKKGLLITSETVGEKSLDSTDNPAIAFLKDPTAEIIANQYQYLLYTPTAESGVDISIRDYFKYQYCFFYNVITATSATQMIARLRDPNIKRFIWIASHAIGLENNSLDYDLVSLANQYEASLMAKNDLLFTTQEKLDYLEKVIDLKKIFITSSDNRQFLETLAKSKYERINGKDCLLALLKESGHQVKISKIETDDQSKKIMKDTTEAIKFEIAETIVKAPMPSDIQYKRLEATPNLSAEESAQKAKYEIEAFTPGIIDSNSWGRDFVYMLQFKDRAYLKKIQRYFLFHNFDNVAHPYYRNREIKKINRSLFTGNHAVFIGDLKTEEVQIKALIDVGLNFFINPDHTWSTETPEFVEFDKKINTITFHEKMGIPIRHYQNGRKSINRIKDVTKFIKKWAEWLGVTYKASKTVRTKNGAMLHTYKPDNAALSSLDFENVMNGVKTRFADYIGGTNAKLKLGTNLTNEASTVENSLQKSAQPETAGIPIQLTLELVADTPYFAIKKEQDLAAS